MRRLNVLIGALPADSRYHTALIDALTDDDWANLPEPDGHGSWAREHHLLALNADRLGQLIHAIYVVNGGKGKPPEPVPRPGLGSSKRVDPARQDLTARYAAYLIEHHGEAPPEGWDPYAS